MIRCLKSARSPTFLLYTTSLINPHVKKSNGAIEAVGLITPHMLINTWQELEYRLDICRPTKGATLKYTDVHKNLLELLCTLLKTGAN